MEGGERNGLKGQALLSYVVSNKSCKEKERWSPGDLIKEKRGKISKSKKPTRGG